MSARHIVLRALLSDAAFLRRLRSAAAATVPSSEIDDLVQKSCLAALEAKLSPDVRGVCEAWMLAVLRHHIADYHEGRHRVQWWPLPWQLRGPDAPLLARDKLRWVKRQLESGRLDEKALDWLERRANGESLTQLARSEEIDPAAMRQRLCYHRKRLREGWAQEEGGTGSVPPPSSQKASIPDFPFVSQPQPLR